MEFGIVLFSVAMGSDSYDRLLGVTISTRLSRREMLTGAVLAQW